MCQSQASNILEIDLFVTSKNLGAHGPAGGTPFHIPALRAQCGSGRAKEWVLGGFPGSEICRLKPTLLEVAWSMYTPILR